MKRPALFLTGWLLATTAMAQRTTVTIYESKPTRLNTNALFPVASRIDWTSPLDPDRTVVLPTFVVKACVTAAKSIARYALYLNDKLQPAPRDLKVEKDACENTFEQTVQLQEGENRIRLIAYQAGGPEVTASLSVIYKKAAALLQEKRLALVIGNSSYPGSSQLANPANDAQDVATTLRDLGFEVMLYTNLDKKKMRQAIDDFGFKLIDYQLGMFYYAGHGVQSEGVNYLVPVDANPQAESDIRFDCLQADLVVGKMEQARTANIIVLDACRNNPFERSLRRGGNEGGLAGMDAPSGSYIAYATAPGKTAADGTGRNGLYTSALLNNLKVPNLPIEQVFKRVRLEVKRQSNDRQEPWESSSLTKDIYFIKK